MNENLNQQDNQIVLRVEQLPIVWFYLRGILYADVVILFIGVYGLLGIEYQIGIKVIYSILGVSSLFIIYGVIDGIRKYYIEKYWAVFWINIALILIGVIVVIEKWWIVYYLYFLITLGLVVSILERLLTTNCNHLLFVFSVNMQIYSILLIVYWNQIIEISRWISVSVGVLQLLYVISEIKSVFKEQFNPVSRIAHFFAMYFMVIIIQISVVIAVCYFYQLFYWQFVTLFNHVLCILIFMYFKKYYPKKGVVVDQAPQEEEEYIYQLSTSHFCKESEYLFNLRVSILDKPLDNCAICISEQSSLCYEQCLHACICHKCQSTIMSNNMRKCPVCRASSNRLLQIQKIDLVKFKVVGRYMFEGGNG